MSVNGGGTLSRVQIQDIPKQEARGYKAIGMIGAVTTRPVANNKTEIAIPLSYRLSPTDNEDRRFTARLFVQEEWLSADFTEQVRMGKVDEHTTKLYNINIRGNGGLAGLFRSAGVETGELDFTNLSGKLVGFKTVPQTNDPSRLQVSYFFKA